MRAREFAAEGWSKSFKKSINCSNPKGFSQKAHCAGKNKNESVSEQDTLDENLRDWFGKGKAGGAGGGGWDRYNTKGERIGKCGDRKPGEGKPKCLSKSKAASLRASNGKKEIANAVKRKKSKDKNPDREGKAKNVSNTAESSMSTAAKNPSGPKFGGYYSATQKGAPKPGQGFGGAAESVGVELDEVAPPGMEDTVLKLKKQYPGEPQKAYATAWSMYNKQKGKK